MDNNYLKTCNKEQAEVATKYLEAMGFIDNGGFKGSEAFKAGFTVLVVNLASKRFSLERPSYVFMWGTTTMEATFFNLYNLTHEATFFNLYNLTHKETVELLGKKYYKEDLETVIKTLKPVQV